MRVEQHLHGSDLTSCRIPVGELGYFVQRMADLPVTPKSAMLFFGARILPIQSTNGHSFFGRCVQRGCQWVL